MSRFVLASAFFFLSGAVALFYQVIWIKVLTLHFGHSAWSVSTVVAVFMGGLGFGSWKAEALLRRIPRPLFLYGVIEVAIGLYGLVLFPVLQNLPWLLAPVYDASWVFVLVRVVVVFILLFPPTVLMGASLPVLVAGLSEDATFQRVVAFLYGINTLGSALGALAAGFLLLPLLGLFQSNLVAVGAGVLIGVAVMALGRFHTVEVPSAPAGDAGGTRATAVLLAAAVLGFVGLFLEVIWTRMLSPVLGSSTYTFTLIITVYLIGTALGSLLSARVKPNLNHAWFWVGGIVFAIAMLSAFQPLIVNNAPALLAWVVSKIDGKMWLFFPAQAAVAASLVLIPTLGLGFVFPLLVALYKNTGSHGARALGRVYAANTLGSIAGALTAGFVFLPLVGVSHSMLLLAAVGLALSTVSIAASPLVPVSWRRPLAGAALLLFVVMWAFGPKIHLSQLYAGYFRGALKNINIDPRQSDLLFIKDGVSSTVSVFRTADSTWLSVNGKPDASTGSDVPTQYMLGHLPMAFNPQARRVCVIGYGSGATVAAVAASPVERIDVVELEPAVLKASRFFASLNHNIVDDPRVQFHVEDGRTFLAYTKNKYDVVISEPSNPWIAGIGALFTTEYYAQVKSKLSDGGVFCQWIQQYEISNETLNVMLRTFSDAFPYVHIFLVGSDFICLGSMTPMSNTWQAVSDYIATPAMAPTLNRIRIDNPYDLLVGYYATFPDDHAMFETSLRNTDDNSWLEYRAPLEMYQGLSVHPPFPKQAIVMPRYQSLFFSDRSKSEVVIGIAEAIAKNRPSALARLDAMIHWAAQSTLKVLKTQMEEFRDLADMRATRKQTQAKLIEECHEALAAHQYEQAKKLLDDPSFLEDPQKEFFRLKGRALMGLGVLPQAMSYFEKAIAANSDDYEAAAFLGLLCLSHDRVDEGLRLLHRSLELNPYYFVPRSYLIGWYDRTDDMVARRQLLRSARRLFSRPQYQDFSENLKMTQDDEFLDYAHQKASAASAR